MTLISKTMHCLTKPRTPQATDQGDVRALRHIGEEYAQLTNAKLTAQNRLHSAEMRNVVSDAPSTDLTSLRDELQRASQAIKTYSAEKAATLFGIRDRICSDFVSASSSASASPSAPLSTSVTETLSDVVNAVSSAASFAIASQLTNFAIGLITTIAMRQIAPE